MQIISKNEDDTAALAAQLAKDTRGTAIYCLYGDLGAGKSVFARSFIQTLAGKYTEVPSPTFTLVQEYEGESAAIYHFDLYRIEDTEEIYELGWEDIAAQNIVLVEWPQRLGHLMPQKRTDITITIKDDQSREINVEHHK